MLKLLLCVGMLLLTAIFISGCSKSSTGPGGNAPTLVAPVLVGPVPSLSADTSVTALTVIGFVAQFDTIGAGYVSLFIGLSGSESGNVWTWTHQYPTGGTIRWTDSTTSNGGDWKLVENGSFPNGSFDNWIALTGYESSDGKTGNWVIFNDNSTAPADSVEWSTDQQGNLDGEAVVCNSSGEVTQTVVFSGVNANHTGEAKLYAGPISTSYEDVNWTPNGGTWTIYFEGVAVNNGNW